MTNETASSRSRPRWEVDAKDHGFSIRHVKLDGFTARLMNSEVIRSQMSNVMRRHGDHVSIVLCSSHSAFDNDPHVYLERISALLSASTATGGKNSNDGGST